MNETAIIVEDLGKIFYPGIRRAGTFKEHLHQKLKQISEEPPKHVTALEGVTFKVARGEAIGIIGPNGSGKSTLLRILSGITAPTSGKVEISGRVASVLDLGTGFHPDLSGLENIYLSGEILGMKRREIKGKIDEIVAFSELEKFIHTPVKHYSSGMYIRLAFSVIAYLDADILLLDEVISVGDAAFQIKSYKKMQELLTSGKTILLVSHNLSSILRFTNRCFVLKDGLLYDDGSTENIVSGYTKEIFPDALKLELDKNVLPSFERIWEEPKTAPGNDLLKLHKIRVKGEKGQNSEDIYTDEKIAIEVKFWRFNVLEKINLAIRVNDFNGNPLFGASTLLDSENNNKEVCFLDPGYKTVQCIIPENLFNSSTFFVDFFVLNCKNEVILSIPYILYFETKLKNANANKALYTLTNLPFFPKTNWIYS